MFSRKKITQKVTLEHSQLTPLSQAWMWQEKLGHEKLFTYPLPPSSNMDKLHFSRGELINTLWLTYLYSQVKYFNTWNRKFSCCKASRNTPNCVETETQKWTWDMWQKYYDPSPHKNMSPFWWTKKRDFLPPSLPYGPMSPSQQFFFLEGIPYQNFE